MTSKARKLTITNCITYELKTPFKLKNADFAQALLWYLCYPELYLYHNSIIYSKYCMYRTSIEIYYYRRCIEQKLLNIKRYYIIIMYNGVFLKHQSCFYNSLCLSIHSSVRPLLGLYLNNNAFKENSRKYKMFSKFLPEIFCFYSVCL